MFVLHRYELPQKTQDYLRTLTPKFGYNGFGEVVFYRTYSRIKKDGGQENWADCVIRVVNGTFSIRKDFYIKNHCPWNQEYWDEYAHDFAVSMFNMEWLPPGRGLWAMGSDFVYERGAMALYNCSACLLKEENELVEDFGWLMDCLMHGVGVGFAPLRSKMKIYKPKGTFDYIIPDTREGWVEATKFLLKAYLVPDQAKPNLIYDYIRPALLLIKGFGGLSSGPDPLILLHKQIIEQCETFKDSVIFKTNIANLIGCCVVSGNVRRSAEIACGDINDQVFLDLKDYKKYPEREMFGWMSNNSAIFNNDNDFDCLGEIAKRNTESGDPGILNKKNFPFARIGKSMKGLKYDAGLLCNPCGEIILEDKEVCNLAETLPTMCKTLDDWYEACEYAAFYCSTVSLLPTNQPTTNKVIGRNRRIGVGIIDFTGWKQEHGVHKVTRWLRNGYNIIRETNKWCNDEAGVPESVRVTTIKPGGCRTFDSLTCTTSGILTIEELFDNHDEGEIWAEYKENNSVFQDEKVQNKIKRTYYNGIAPTYIIKLTYGFELECTADHQWFVERFHDTENKGKNLWTKMGLWKPTRSLGRGHVLGVKPGIYTKFEHSKLQKFNKISIKTKISTKDIKQPDEMNPDLAWLLGYLWGDGSMSPGGYRLRFIDGHYINLKKAQRIFKEQFDLDANIHPAAEGKKANVLEVGSKVLWHWLLKNNVFKYLVDKDLNIIPKVIRTSAHEDILAFLAGLIDSDGCVSSTEKENRLIFNSSDKDFAKHFQDIALAVGVTFGRGTSYSESRKGQKDLWMLTTTPESISERFAILEKHSNKCQFLNKNILLPWSHQRGDHKISKIFGKIEEIYPSGEKQTFDIEVENEHYYYAGGFKSHNSVPKLPGKTSGAGHPTFTYTLRRIRIQQNSPIHKILTDALIPYEKDFYSANTDVFEFPILQGPAKPASEVSLWEQANNIVLLQREWADNAVSNTLYFKPMWILSEHYWDHDYGKNLPENIYSIEDKIERDLGLPTLNKILHNDLTEFIVTERVKYTFTYHKERCFINECKIYEYDPKHEENDIEPVLSSIVPLIKSVSLLPHSAVGVYKQMPEEGISKLEYERRLATIKPIDWSTFRGSDGMDEKYCVGDKCEIPQMTLKND